VYSSGYPNCYLTFYLIVHFSLDSAIEAGQLMMQNCWSRFFWL
jgi:hypothetical protein